MKFCRLSSIVFRLSSSDEFNAEQEFKLSSLPSECANFDGLITNAYSSLLFDICNGWELWRICEICELALLDEERAFDEDDDGAELIWFNNDRDVQLSELFYSATEEDD